MISSHTDYFSLKVRIKPILDSVSRSTRDQQEKFLDEIFFSKKVKILRSRKNTLRGKIHLKINYLANSYCSIRSVVIYQMEKKKKKKTRRIWLQKM